MADYVLMSWLIMFNAMMNQCKRPEFNISVMLGLSPTTTMLLNEKHKGNYFLSIQQFS